MKKAASCILGEGVSCLRLIDNSIEVGDDRGGDKDGGARREFYDQTAFPEYEVATFCAIKRAKSSNCTIAKRQVSKVMVGVANGVQPKVKCGSWIDAVEKWSLEGRDFFLKRTQIFDVMFVHFRSL